MMELILLYPFLGLVAFMLILHVLVGPVPRLLAANAPITYKVIMSLYIFLQVIAALLLIIWSINVMIMVPELLLQDQGSIHGNTPTNFIPSNSYPSTPISIG